MMLYTWSEGSQVFDRQAHSDNTISFYGAFPVFEQDPIYVNEPDVAFRSMILEDAADWWTSIQNVTKALKEDPDLAVLLEKNNGYVFNHTSYIRGFITIRVNPETTTEDLGKMVQIIETHAQEEGLSNVPIVFVQKTGTPLITDEKICFTNEYEKHYTLSSYFGFDTNKSQEIPTYYTNATYVINVSDPKELAGSADYVFVGKVDKIAGTEYKFPVMIEVEENGKIKEVEVGDPYTNYYITVVENIKGELVQNQSIPVLKEGGITKDRKYYILPEDDFLPEEGKIYIFYAYAQPDGSLLITGPNSNVEIKTDSVKSENIEKTSEYQETLKAFENQKIQERERFVSTYDVREN
ncbi:hypothetical protein [Methanolapillus africanus]